MNAKVTITKDVRFNEIVIGDYTLSEILNIIHTKTTECLQNISIENQSEKPNFTDIDAPLHGVLNLIEQVRGL
ncbi:MAG: hypothetical protein WC319_07730 [Candidatus Paceibacterota bacterium]|jgi:hypothetical protein